MTPPEYKCGVCEKPIEGVVYFASAYYHRPVCSDCARLAKWRKLVGWYATFRPDEEPPARDADLPALELPPARECDVCGRSIAWLVWRQSRMWVCSYGCRDERGNARRRVEHEPRSCAWCGELFTPKRNDARTCSAAHRQALHRFETGKSETAPPATRKGS